MHTIQYILHVEVVKLKRRFRAQAARSRLLLWKRHALRWKTSGRIMSGRTEGGSVC